MKDYFKQIIDRLKTYFRRQKALLERLSVQEYVDRTISGGIKGQVGLLLFAIALVLIVFFLLVSVFDINLGAESRWYDRIWAVYCNFFDSGSSAAQKGIWNRIAGTCISLFGSILLGGVLISTISNIIERRVEKVRNGKVSYSKIKDHFVIIGYTKVTASLIKELYREDPKAKIIVMTSQESEQVRHNLQAALDNKIEVNVYIYFGNIESEEELQRLNINKAKEVYILGEEGDYGRDSKNIHCVLAVSALKGDVKKGEQLNVYTQFDRLSSYSVIQKFNILVDNKGQDCGEDFVRNIYFRPFNLNENWARRLWSLYSLEEEIPYDTLDYEPVTIRTSQDSKVPEKYVHLVIAGFSGMGQALLLEALRVCHYPYYREGDEENKRVKTRITVVDKDVMCKYEHFSAQYPNIREQVWNIDIDCREEDFCSEPFRRDLVEWASDPSQLVTIAVCVSDPDVSVALGMSLPAEIYKSETRVLIRQEIQTDLGNIIHKDTGRYRNVKVFGMLEKGISKNMLLDDLASFANRNYELKEKTFIQCLYNCMVEGKQEEFISMKEEARASWINLEENMRLANRYQIDAYVTFFNALGYRLDKSVPEGYEEVSYEAFIGSLADDVLLALMSMEKYRWNAERTIQGWKYGPKRDNIHRVHPMIVPFKKVPDEEKLKDKNVIVNMYYMASLAGYKVMQLKKH